MYRWSFQFALYMVPRMIMQYGLLYQMQLFIVRQFSLLHIINVNSFISFGIFRKLNFYLFCAYKN